MGVLNARLGKTLDDPLHAPVVLFGVGFLGCLLTAIVFTGSLPSFSNLGLARPLFEDQIQRQSLLGPDHKLAPRQLDRQAYAPTHLYTQ